MSRQRVTKETVSEEKSDNSVRCGYYWLVAYIIFSRYELMKRKPRESVGKQESVVSETKESAGLKKREEIYRRAAEKDKNAIDQLLHFHKGREI